jgi:hypothetical protein
MSYVKLTKDGTFEQWPYREDDLRNQNRNTSFPIQAIKVQSVRDSFGIKEVKSVEKPSYTESTQRLIEQTPVLDNGEWTQVWEVKEKTNAEKTADNGFQWEKVRNQRNQKLEETDWQMVKALETGEDASDLRTYRQKLRDIPQDQNDPFSITWPEL